MSNMIIEAKLTHKSMSSKVGTGKILMVADHFRAINRRIRLISKCILSAERRITHESPVEMLLRTRITLRTGTDIRVF